MSFFNKMLSHFVLLYSDLNLGIEKEVEILFAIDSSSGTSQKDIAMMSDFIKNVLEQYKNTQKDNNLGLLNYGSYTKSELDLSKNNRENLLKALVDLKKVDGERNLSPVFEKASLEMSYAMDPNTKHLVVFVLGKINPSDISKTLEAAEILRSKSIKITLVALSTGPPINFMKELTGDTKQVIIIDSVAKLPKVIDDINSVIGSQGKIRDVFSLFFPIYYVFYKFKLKVLCKFLS